MGLSVAMQEPVAQAASLATSDTRRTRKFPAVLEYLPCIKIDRKSGPP